jgi:hypothetical protein
MENKKMDLDKLQRKLLNKLSDRKRMEYIYTINWNEFEFYEEDGSALANVLNVFKHEENRIEFALMFFGKTYHKIDLSYLARCFSQPNGFLESLKLIRPKFTFDQIQKILKSYPYERHKMEILRELDLSGLGSSNHELRMLLTIYLDSDEARFELLQLYQKNGIDISWRGGELFGSFNNTQKYGPLVGKLLDGKQVDLPPPEEPVSLTIKPFYIINYTTPSSSATPKTIPICAICFENPPNVLLMPCKHFAICKACADKLTDCPICRDHITEKIPTFNS